jgi:hypothetical protein
MFEKSYEKVVIGQQLQNLRFYSAKRAYVSENRPVLWR